jgi:phage terminase small subunit
LKVVTAMMPKLTTRQQRFVEEYMVDCNATQAAVRAGYAAKTANREGSRLLSNVDIAAAITAARAAQTGRAEVTADRVLREYARLAFLDIRKAFDEHGNLKPVHELDDDTAAAIAGLEVEEIYEHGQADVSQEGQPHGGSLQRSRGKRYAGRLKKVKLSDKKGALDSLAKHLGMFTDKLEMTGKGGKDLHPPGRPPTDAELAAGAAMLAAAAAALNDPPPLVENGANAG